MARLLSGPAAELTAKLTEKSRYRPTALIRRILPAGAECLESVPTLERGGLAGAEPTAEQLARYVAEVRAAAAVFATSNMQHDTLAEHDKYIVWIDAWAKLSGFGSYVVVDTSVRAPAIT